jgi:hypothetical protein
MQIKVNLGLKITSVIVILFFISLWSCRNAATTNSKLDIGYDLEHPDRMQSLPAILREISGITLLDSNTIACIQDENGIVFLYDILQNKIRSQSVFYENGDYEGICKVDTAIFILRSDGALFEISNYQSNILKVNTYPTEMPGSNNEGLCYDKKHKRLLIARKNKIAKGKEFKNKRAIYTFDLTTKKLDSKPVFEFDVDTIRKIVSEEKIALPVKQKKEKKEKKKERPAQTIIHFASSEIAIHPITNKLFLLSALDHLLFVINEYGRIEHITQLNPTIFVQPEGIAFKKNGDMFITNEGQNKNSTLLEFKYR